MTFPLASPAAIDHNHHMNNEANTDIFGSSILYSETAAVQVDMLARRLRRNGSVGWANDYDALAAEHAANAGEDRASQAAHEARIAAIRSA
jgi:hypothetical protein